MHIRVHRPVVCVVCRSELPDAPCVAGWFHCTTCGMDRRP